MKHAIEFEIRGSDVTAINDRIGEICNGFFGTGCWECEMETMAPAEPVRGTRSLTRPVFVAKVRAEWTLSDPS